jgi:hypothetical protein
MTPREHLIVEGLREDQITYEKDFHFENNVGFFSFRFEHGVPFMTHFLVYPEKRGMLAMLRLYMMFKVIVMSLGFDKFIAEVIPEKPYFRTLLKKMGCDKPYALNEENGSEYYLVHLR